MPDTIQGCIQNNPRDQKNLYERCYGFSLKIVFRYVYHYDKAADVVNDGFVKIFKNIHVFYCKQPESLEAMFLGWIRTIMINTAIDRLRKDDFLPEIGIINKNVWIEDKGQASDQALLYKELIQEVKKLPPVYRAVFNMYCIDGFSHQEIASQLKIAVGTSKSNLFKAREILQKAIKKIDQEIIYAGCK